MELRHALLSLCLLVPLCAAGDPERPAPPEPYDFLFDTALEAYYRSDWLAVILNMEKALRNKALVRDTKAQCRMSCANHTAFGVPIPGDGSVEDLGFFHKILKRADCVNSCEQEKLGVPSMHKVSEEVELEFKKRTPYNYLQVAYFKINKVNKAVAAAYTFFVANPDHAEMRQNLEYYKLMAGVEEEDFKDLEATPHMAEFLKAKSYYSHESFGLAADDFESAVVEYFNADKECRALCEGSYNYDGYNYMDYSVDLFQSMTDHYMQVLNCKQHCVLGLASTAGRDKPFEDFLASHFNYLQFSYYNSEKYEPAIECAKTYLLFHPNDEVMKQNLAYYSVVLGEEKAQTISARKAVQNYISNSLLEKELLYFGYEAFGITFVDPDTWTPEDIMPKKLREKQKVEREAAARITEEIGNLMKEIETLVEEKKKDSSSLAQLIVPEEQADVPPSPVPPSPDATVLYDNIRVTMTSKQLNGTDRVLLDGVINDDECRELQRLSNAAAQGGDGYRGRSSPHSPSETFQGVTVLKAVKLAQEGVVPLKSTQLFYDMSERVKKVLASYFVLETPLYFSYSHLVCRAAIEEKQEDREDLSHPVHADNCLLVSELNECIKEPPAYTHRDYSAILYLNDDFEGGDFIFTQMDAKTVTAHVRPRCGRVVGFGAGKENPHGVRAVTRGQRCAVALWFTLDPNHDEKERIQAKDMLDMFSTPVNAEFIKKAAEAAPPAPAPAPAPAQETADERQADEATEQKANGQADKPAETPEDKTESTPVSETAKTTAKKGAKAKAAPKAKAKAGAPAKAKAKAADKSKPAVKKQTQAKTTSGKKDTKPAEKKTEKVAKKAKDGGTSASDSPKDKKVEL